VTEEPSLAGFAVRPGQIRLASIDVLMNTDKVLVLQADTHSKYAGDWSLSSGWNSAKPNTIDLFP